MNGMNTKKVLVILTHALVGWALCGAIIGVGFAIWSVETTLIVHLIGAPVVFALLSWLYFGKFNYTAPLQTAIIFLAVVILADFIIVALLIERSFDMFGSLIGTWIPWAFLFLSTWLTGRYITEKQTETRAVA